MKLHGLDLMRMRCDVRVLPRLQTRVLGILHPRPNVDAPSLNEPDQSM
jgi:hypothetical protein